MLFVARFLSTEWFEEVSRHGPPGPLLGAGPVVDGRGRIALEVVVTGVPEGEVRYQVVVEGASAGVRWRREDLVVPGVRFTADFATLAGLAQGRMTAVEALSGGGARVGGDTALLAQLPALADLVPPAVRAGTTF
jgi:hypothetical protein